MTFAASQRGSLPSSERQCSFSAPPTRVTRSEMMFILEMMFIFFFSFC